MEANMSPNFYAGADLKNSFETYRDTIENVMKIVGLGDKTEKPTESDLATNSIVCSQKCSEACHLKECQSCVKCMTKQTKENLIRAYKEQLNVGEFRRVVPPTSVSF
jgi:hypothetical protein